MALRRILAAAALLPLCSCITIKLAGGSSDHTVYRLSCPVPAEAPATGCDIRVRDFSCASEYDRTGMVLVDSSGVVTRTSGNRWASSPSVALSDLITRDLVAEGSFTAVLRRSVMDGIGVILEGGVREFGARQSGGVWLAVIDTDLTLFDAVSGSVIDQTRIELHSPMSSTGFPELARAMSTLAAQWSAEARMFVHSAIGGAR